METKQLLELLKDKKDGVDFSIEYSGDLPLNAAAKKNGIIATKITKMIAKKGIKYSDLQSVKDRINEGLELTHELPWGMWKYGFEGLLIEHKDSDYIRLYPKADSFSTTYYIGNKEVTYDELKESGYLVNSFFNKKDTNPVEVLTIKVNNIINIE